MGSSDMDLTFNLGNIDLATIIIFLVGIVALGCWLGYSRQSTVPGRSMRTTLSSVGETRAESIQAA